MKKEQWDQAPRDHSRQHIAVGFVVGMLLGGLVDLFTGDHGIGTLIGMILGAIVGYQGLDRVHLMEYPPQAMRNVALAGTLFIVSLAGAMYLLDLGIGDSFQVIFALAPAIAGLFFVVSLALAISKLDELQRRIQVEALAIGFAITALITITYGLLGLTGTPQPNWMFVTLVMTGAWLAGKLWTRWKYR